MNPAARSGLTVAAVAGLGGVFLVGVAVGHLGSSADRHPRPGVVAGPPSFALLSSLTGSYRIGFVAFAVFCAGAALALLRQREARR